MYIEENGYVIMKKDEMSFLDKSGELQFSDDIEEAEIYKEYVDAKNITEDLLEYEIGNYEVINYHKTIWLDRVDYKEKIDVDQLRVGEDGNIYTSDGTLIKKYI